jgi:Arc/MetJ family transcription regulator
MTWDGPRARRSKYAIGAMTSNSQVDIKLNKRHHHSMRTTLTLDDDVMEAAARRAALLKVSLGKAVSDLARRGLGVAPPVREEDGLVVFDPPKGTPRISARKVSDALAEFP